MIRDMIHDAAYMPHGYCLLWKPWLIALHTISDLLISVSYFAIPVAIWLFVKQRPQVELKGLALLFAFFIAFCGITHLVDIVTLWAPVYEAQGVLKAVTAGFSVATALMIFPLIPKALAIPSPRELQTVNERLRGEIASHEGTLAQLEQATQELEMRIRERTRELSEATERFRLLFENAPVAMLLTDREKRVRQINAAGEGLFRYAEPDVVGQPMDALLAVTEDNSDLPATMTGTAAIVGKRGNGETFAVEVAFNDIETGGEAFTVTTVIDVSERLRSERHVQAVMRELSHRAKNLLAVVQGMIRQAIATSPDMRTFEKTFTGRILGLARSHDLLVSSNWEGAPMTELIGSQLEFLGLGTGPAITCDGPFLILSPSATQNMGMALHELATNALNHGALTNEGGTISISWQILNDRDERTVEIIWSEKGKTSPPDLSRKGFGRAVLEKIVPASLGGTADVTFSPEGAIWVLNAPLNNLVVSTF